ncbi:hypothetical protein [Metabacillus iocasae]|uniref:Beta-carotene 15,15'-monooxygenase n=1 Tax=Priestia iocasae TaxID=2291674 RepID=A0ABS2QW08_9BACI|nr:hypothetical protein [Metabacillus iocasae]MBM7703656.1 hypothetical protein [Metabacillus iocasae]
MSIQLRKQKVTLYIFLMTLVIFSNYAVYTFPVLESIPKSAVLGSLFDFLVVCPLLTYFFILRKRYSLKYMVPVIFAGYVVAKLVIPHHYLAPYSFIPYLFIAGELAFVALELFILYKLIVKLPTIIRTFSSMKSEWPYVSVRLQAAVGKHVGVNPLIHALTSEVTMFYYAFLSWRARPSQSCYPTFTFHKKTSVIAMNIMIIHAILIETIGFHYLLSEWNHIVSWVLLILNIYTVLFFIGEIQAIRKCPFIISDKKMIMQVGLTKCLILPIEKIKNMDYYEESSKLSKQEEKMLFDATVSDLFKQPPQFEITLKEPVTAYYLFGKRKQVNKVWVTVDEPESFLQVLKPKG